MNQNANPPAASMPKPTVPKQIVLDVETIHRDFPILQRKVHGKPLVWLDNAATSQKPQAVIEQVSRYNEHENSNIHRGTHCALPILTRFGLQSSVRPSFAFYNTRAEADALIETLRRISLRR